MKKKARIVALEKRVKRYERQLETINKMAENHLRDDDPGDWHLVHLLTGGFGWSDDDWSWAVSVMDRFAKEG